MTRIGTRERALIGALATVLVLGALYMLAIKPEHQKANRLGRQIAAAQTSLLAAQRSYDSGRAAQRRLRAETIELSAAEQAVPEKADVPALLRLLQRTAAAAHVSILTIGVSSSGASASSATASSTNSTMPATATPESGAQPVSLALTISGGYQALNRLVQRLDRLVAVSDGQLHADGPLVSISGVSLSPGGSSNSSASLSVSLSATIYQRAATASAAGSTSGGSS